MRWVIILVPIFLARNYDAAEAESMLRKVSNEEFELDVSWYL